MRSRRNESTLQDKNARLTTDCGQR